MDMLELLKSLWIALIVLAGTLVAGCVYLVTCQWTGRGTERAEQVNGEG